MLSPDMSLLRAFVVALGLTTAPAFILLPFSPMPVMAEDDDDDEGDDDDDDDGSDSDSDDDDDNWSFVPPVRRVPPTAPVSLPDQAPDQLVIEGLPVLTRDALLEQGFSMLSEAGGRTLLELPDDLNVDEALNAVRALAPAIVAAPNSYYRSQAVPSDCTGGMCDHWEAVGWPPADVDPLCRFEPHIGVVDTGVNTDHDMLVGANLTVESSGDLGAEPSEHKHGTAIVAMFVGNGQDRVPGLAPAARLLVVDPFVRVGGDERSDVFSLAAALDRIGEAGVTVANLSLAGPENAVLQSAVQRLQEQGIALVAAVGNGGPRSQPLFPAAYPGVVGVTAVDSNSAIYRRAVQGPHVSFAAPGVDIHTAASISGVRPQTGTSFAVPFVATALAAAMADGTQLDLALDELAANSRDLGDPGRDAVFGWGLVQIPSPC